MVYAGKSLREIKDRENGVSNPIHGATLKALYQSFANTSPLAAALAELEALDWRPITERPVKPGLYQTAEFLKDGTLYEIGHTFWTGDEWDYNDLTASSSSMTHYRRIPRLHKSAEKAGQ